MSHTSARIIVACAVACFACDGETSPVFPRVDALELVFLTQSEPQSTSMDALFAGRIIVDSARCTRLDAPDGATVVWPAGYTVRQDGDDVLVIDNEGGVAGRLGESFRIAGGEVSQLHPALHISYMDRARAHESCPGKFWIAAD